MGDGGSLIDLGKLSEPATTLINRVSDAVGGIAKPWQIKRVAQAESQAEIIRANARVEISDIERRGLERMVREEGMRQANIENITAAAIPHLSADAKPENIEEDWLSHFFERARTTSAVEMQALWAKILAGESNAPGQFARKTVDLVATLDRTDAETFGNLCNFVWFIGWPVAIILDLEAPDVESCGMDFNAFSHLESLGLISFSHLGDFLLLRITKRLDVRYHDISMSLQFPKEAGNELPTGLAFLTRAGRELATICTGQPKDAYLQDVITRWKTKNIEIVSGE